MDRHRDRHKEVRHGFYDASKVKHRLESSREKSSEGKHRHKHKKHKHKHRSAERTNKQSSESDSAEENNEHVIVERWTEKTLEWTEKTKHDVSRRRPDRYRSEESEQESEEEYEPKPKRSKKPKKSKKRSREVSREVSVERSREVSEDSDISIDSAKCKGKAKRWKLPEIKPEPESGNDSSTPEQNNEEEEVRVKQERSDSIPPPRRVPPGASSRWEDADARVKNEPRDREPRDRDHHLNDRRDNNRRREDNRERNPFPNREETNRQAQGDGNEDAADPEDKVKPNFGLSGKLTEETNTYRGVVIKYSEPPEARKPKKRWRLYPFKGDQALPVLHISRQSAYLLGRDRKIADFPIDHPSCSKQHAALQYRLVDNPRKDGTMGRQVRPYILDLDSPNGTFVNNKRIDPRRYVELQEKDVLKFGYSSREYVLLHDKTDTSEQLIEMDSGED